MALVHLHPDDVRAEIARYFAGDPKARPPEHLYRLMSTDDMLDMLGEFNWAHQRRAKEREVEVEILQYLEDLAARIDLHDQLLRIVHKATAVGPFIWSDP